METDPRVEGRIPLLKSMSIYVPRDERFGQIKMSDLLAFAVKSIIHFLRPGIEGLCGDEFDSFADIMKLYEGGIKIPKGHFAESFLESIPYEMLKEIFRPDGDILFKFPMPQVIKGAPFTYHSNIGRSNHFPFSFSLRFFITQRTRMHGGLMKNLQEKCLQEWTQMLFAVSRSDSFSFSVCSIHDEALFLIALCAKLTAGVSSRK